MNDLKNSVIFAKGDKITNDYFIGETWLEMLMNEDEIYHCPISNVTFAPGARNNWHIHPGGQLLLLSVEKEFTKKKENQRNLLLLVMLLKYHRMRNTGMGQRVKTGSFI